MSECTRYMTWDWRDENWCWITTKSFLLVSGFGKKFKPSFGPWVAEDLDSQCHNHIFYIYVCIVIVLVHYLSTWAYRSWFRYGYGSCNLGWNNSRMENELSRVGSKRIQLTYSSSYPVHLKTGLVTLTWEQCRSTLPDQPGEASPF